MRNPVQIALRDPSWGGLRAQAALSQAALRKTASTVLCISAKQELHLLQDNVGQFCFWLYRWQVTKSDLKLH